MPLHFAMICLAQIFLSLEWNTYHQENVLNTNFTLRTSFDNYLDFNQCCDRKPCVTPGAPGLDIGVVITDFVTLISTLIDKIHFDTTPHVLVLVSATIVMVIYFMIECCIGNMMSMVEFISGPSIKIQETEQSTSRNDETETERDNAEETGQSTSRNDETETERDNAEETKPPKKKRLKKSYIVIQIICFLFVILYIIALLMSPQLFNQTLTFKLFTCEDELWDSNPNEPLHCIGMFYVSTGFSG